MSRLKSKMKPKWKCSSCTYMNAPEKETCAMCEAPNTGNKDSAIKSNDLGNFVDRGRMDTSAQLAMALKLFMDEHKEQAESAPAAAIPDASNYQPPQMNQAHPAAMQQNPYGQPMMAQPPHNFHQMGAYPLPQGNQQWPQYYHPGQPMAGGPHMRQPMFQNYAAQPQELKPIPEPGPQQK